MMAGSRVEAKPVAETVAGADGAGATAALRLIAGKPAGRTRAEQIALNQRAIASIDAWLASVPTEEDLAEAAGWGEFLAALEAAHPSSRRLFGG